jgi:hypothetical protein
MFARALITRGDEMWSFSLELVQGTTKQKNKARLEIETPAEFEAKVMQQDTIMPACTHSHVRLPPTKVLNRLAVGCWRRAKERVQTQRMAAAADVNEKDTHTFQGKAWLDYMAECERGERCGMHVIAVRVTSGGRGKVSCFGHILCMLINRYPVSLHA